MPCSPGLPGSTQGQDAALLGDGVNRCSGPWQVAVRLLRQGHSGGTHGRGVGGVLGEQRLLTDSSEKSWDAGRLGLRCSGGLS